MDSCPLPEAEEVPLSDLELPVVCGFRVPNLGALVYLLCRDKDLTACSLRRHAVHSLLGISGRVLQARV